MHAVTMVTTAVLLAAPIRDCVMSHHSSQAGCQPVVRGLLCNMYLVQSVSKKHRFTMHRFNTSRYFTWYVCKYRCLPAALHSRPCPRTVPDLLQCHTPF